MSDIVHNPRLPVLSLPFLLFSALGLAGLLTLFFGAAGPALATLATPLVIGLGLLGLLLQPTGWGPWPVRALLGGGAVLLLYMGLQLLPAATLGLPPHPFQATLAELGLSARWPSVALQPETTVRVGLLLVGLAALAAWGVAVARREEVALRLVQGVAVITLLFACYGLLVYATGNTRVLWLPKEDYPESLSGTLISRNHAATFLGLGLLSSLALALRRVGEISRRLDARQRLKAFYWLVLRPGAGWLAAAGVIWFALILTASRAGLSAALLGLAILLLALLLARPGARLGLGLILATLATLGGLTLGLLGTTLERRAALLADNPTQARAAINDLSAHAATNLPVLGHGPGAWAAATAPFRGPEGLHLNFPQIGNAHNLYWQSVLELGWPGALLAAGLVLGLAGCFVYGLQTRRRQVVYPALGLAVLAQLASHSVVDFPLSIPAIALLAVLVLAACVAQSFKHADLSPPSGPRRVLVALPLVPLLIISLWLAWAELAYLRAAPTLASLRAGAGVSLPAQASSREALLTCTARLPWHTRCLDGLTLLYLNRAGEVGPTSAAGRLWLRAAELYGRQALSLDPADPVTAYRLSRALELQRGPAAAAPFLLHSVLMGPREARLAEARLGLLLRLWPQLAPAEATLVTRHVRDLWATDARRVWRAVRANRADRLRLATVLAAGATPAELEQSLPARWQEITRQAWPLGSPGASF